jgi:hypothetical protein
MINANKKGYAKPEIAELSSSHTMGGTKPKDATEDNGNGMPGTPGDNRMGPS